MPLFEFTCENCKTDFEELFCSPDTSKVICIKCGSKKVVKKMSAFGVKAGRDGCADAHKCDGCCSHREACPGRSFT